MKLEALGKSLAQEKRTFHHGVGLHGILKLLNEIILKFKLDHKLINDINILYQDTFTEHNIIQYFYPNHSFDSIIFIHSPNTWYAISQHAQTFILKQ